MREWAVSILLRSADGSWVASASRATTFAIAAAALSLMLVACGAGLPAPTHEITAESPAVGTTGLDCAGIVQLAPHDAADTLSSVGLSVAWRLVHTTSDGNSVADVVQATPQGVIVDIVIVDNEAIVFVADPNDPSAASPPPPSC